MTTQLIEKPLRTEDFVELENQYGAHNYRPLDVVIERAEGVWVYDVEGKRYLDCLAAYSAVNQGHCHPKILQTLRGAGPESHSHLARIPQRATCLCSTRNFMI